MALEAGHKLGVYEILAPIGKGGMGEVYRARDTKLGRDVAVKVLPDELAADQERVARFEREARLLASLNHPNIASVHGFEESDGVKALVLELVEGSTLAERIGQGPIPLDEAIAIAKQIAEALEAGHDAGIIHRDLKPANIKLKEDGNVKVLDYGLAKALEGERTGDGNPELSQSPTLTRQGTQVGVILGTAGYMSPEQAKGKRVDKRADVWAFGAVLYEMLAGKRAFAGDDVSEVLAAVIKSEPDWDALPAETPESLRRLLSRCLRKDQRVRLHDIADAWLELVDAGNEPTAAPSRPYDEGTRYRYAFIGSVFATLLAILWALRGTTTESADVIRLDVNLPSGHALPDDYSRVFVLSPDGRQLVYTTGPADKSQFFLRELDDFTVRRLGVDAANMPFFSPDGQWLGFYAGGSLQKISVSGGAPLPIAQTPRLLSGGSWGSQGTIVIATPGSTLQRVSADGGELEKIEKNPSEEVGVNPFWPHLLPNTLGVIFTARTPEGFRPAVHSFRTGESRFLALIGGGRGARYIRTGHVVYAEGDQLLAAPFDLDDLEITGVPKAVVDGVYSSPTSGLAYFDVSDSGTLAYVSKQESPDGNELVIVDRAGQLKRVGGESNHYLNPHFSPDGQRIAVTIRPEPNKPDVWIFDLRSGSRTRLTSSGNVEQALWTPDGERVTFVSARLGPSNIFWKPVDASGDEEPLFIHSDHHQIGSWTADGTRLAIMGLNMETGLGDLWVLGRDGELSPVEATPFNEQEPSFSPDGRWIAFASDDTGRDEIYVKRVGAAGGKRPISVNGGREPIWSRDGREIFYRQGGAVMAVSVDAGEELAADQARLLFEGAFLSPFMNPSAGETTYDVSPDGESFVMIRPSVESRRDEIHVVINWSTELKRLVPIEN